MDMDKFEDMFFQYCDEKVKEGCSNSFNGCEGCPVFDAYNAIFLAKYDEWDD